MIRLLELRTEKGLSQREIAKQLHVSQGTYNNWENAKTQPSIEQLIQLSALFGVSVDYIIGNVDECGTIGVETQSAEEKAFAGYFRSLSKPAQTALLQFMQNFIGK